METVRVLSWEEKTLKDMKVDMPLNKETESNLRYEENILIFKNKSMEITISLVL